MLAEETGKSDLKRVLRKFAPWYGAVVAFYTPLHAIYGWSNDAAGLLKVPLVVFLFNVSQIAGLTAFFAALFGFAAGMMGVSVGGLGGMLLGFLGFDADVFFRGVVGLFAALGAIGSGSWLLFEFLSDTRDLTETPKYDGIEWFFTVLGATVLLASYFFFGRKLAKRLKTLKAELQTR